MVDTACPGQPEASNITPEAPEGSPSPVDSVSVSSGASASPFPEEQRIEVRAPPGISSQIVSLLSRWTTWMT